MNKYMEGNIIEDTVLFTADDNVTPVDPDSVNLYLTVKYSEVTGGPYLFAFSGASLPSSGQIARTGTGRYVFRIDTTLLPGYWTWEWVGGGVSQAVIASSALVNPLPIPWGSSG